MITTAKYRGRVLRANFIKRIYLVTCIVCALLVWFAWIQRGQMITRTVAVSVVPLRGTPTETPTIIYVASHRRSGTHLLMNTVFNNFNQVSIHKMNHVVPDEFIGCECLYGILNNAFVLYVERDFDAVVRSMFYYMQTFTNKYDITRSTTMDDFLKMDTPLLDIAWMWKHTRDSWKPYVMSGQVLKLRFDDLIISKQQTIDYISKFIGLKPKKRLKKHTGGVGAMITPNGGVNSVAHDIGVRAAWALANVNMTTLRVWNNVETFGNMIRCAKQSNILKCPKYERRGVWLHG